MLRAQDAEKKVRAWWSEGGVSAIEGAGLGIRILDSTVNAGHSSEFSDPTSSQVKVRGCLWWGKISEPSRFAVYPVILFLVQVC